MKFKIIAGILLIVITLGLYCFKNFIAGQNTGSTAEILIEQTSTETLDQSTSALVNEAQQTPVALIIIDVGGEVKNPGIVQLPEGSRVYIAIEKAGGLKQTADTRRINLAAILNDGEKLYIPKFNEVLELTSGSDSSTLININTANSDALQKINGVGPSTAEKIIIYRQSNGPFKKIEEMMNINGIGEKTFEKFKSQITIN